MRSSCLYASRRPWATRVARVTVILAALGLSPLAAEAADQKQIARCKAPRELIHFKAPLESFARAYGTKSSFVLPRLARRAQRGQARRARKRVIRLASKLN